MIYKVKLLLSIVIWGVEWKGKTIIAAGEATHGTGNFYEFKDR